MIQTVKYSTAIKFVLGALLVPGFMFPWGKPLYASEKKVVAVNSKERVLLDRFSYPRFDEASFWYKPIPRETPLHVKSKELSEEFARQVRTYYGVVGINYGDYSAPVYTVSEDTPRVQVELWDCWKSGHKDSQLANDLMNVPIPAEAVPAGGSDAEMVIFDPTADTMWEFWNTRKIDGRWQACWGGKMDAVSTNPGIWKPPYGASATGLPFAPGQVLVDELRRGRIDHVIGIAIVDAEAGVVSWPANRTDGVNPNSVPNRIPEGARFRIDPALDLNTLKLHPIALAIAQAGQTYGFVVWDRAGSVSLRAENPLRYRVVGLPSPYPELFGSTPAYNIMARFPWDKMQFMPLNYGH